MALPSSLSKSSIPSLTSSTNAANHVANNLIDNHSNSPSNKNGDHLVKNGTEACNGTIIADSDSSSTPGFHPLLQPEHVSLVAELRALVQPLRAAEESERLVQLHKSKIKRLRAVSRHLEGELARRKLLKCDRQSQTDPVTVLGSGTGLNASVATSSSSVGINVGGVSVNPYTKAFANRAAVGAAGATGLSTARYASSTAASNGPAAGAAAAAGAASISGYNRGSNAATAANVAPASSFLNTGSLNLPPPPPPPGPTLESLATLPLCLRRPPMLEVCANSADRQSAELHWNLRGQAPDRQHQIVSYSVWYCYQRPGRAAEAWAKTADLRALPLPMRCQVGIDARRGACHFVLRAEDSTGRLGHWSNVVTWPKPSGVNSLFSSQRRSSQQQQQQQFIIN